MLPIDERAPFVCECTRDECLKPVMPTMQEYEAAHMCPNWCAVLPGHLPSDDGARVVFREPHFWVVELSPLAVAGEAFFAPGATDAVTLSDAF